VQLLAFGLGDLSAPTSAETARKLGGRDEKLFLSLPGFLRHTYVFAASQLMRVLKSLNPQATQAINRVSEMITL